jgi:DNA-directed RNA polymerase specialized sigma24 family protein
MSIAHPQFDDLYARWGDEVYRCCFLLTMDPYSAADAFFQTFLYLGAEPKALEDDAAETVRLFSFALRTCEDFYYRKLRRVPKRKHLEATKLPFPVTDALWALLRQPFRKKARFFLADYLGLDEAVVNQLLGRRVGALSLPYGSDVLTQAVAAIVPDHWFADETMDKLVMRFDERSVGVENRLLRARSTMDRLVPWIALALLALGLVAVWIAGKYSV